MVNVKGPVRTAQGTVPWMLSANDDPDAAKSGKKMLSAARLPACFRVARSQPAAELGLKPLYLEQSENAWQVTAGSRA